MTFIHAIPHFKQYLQIEYPYLNTIKHVWGVIGRHLREREQPIKNVRELGQAV